MEQKIVIKNENICIFFIKENNLSFYLLIPKSSQLKITLGLFENVTEEFIKNIKIDSDKALVIPIIQSDILKQANIIGSSSYNYINQVLSFLINTSYKILIYNKIKVDSQILLSHSNQLETFEQNFISKYQGRVQLINLLEEVSPTQELITQKEEKLIEKDSLETKTDNIENIIPTKLPAEEEQIPKKESHEPGFVSYVLLGVVFAVISLIILYFLI